jgi:hypothetical protein
MCEDEITRYDNSEKTGTRTDFLSQLRQREEKLTAANPQGNARPEILNHLSTNLSVSANGWTELGRLLTFLRSRLAGSDTTAISLRACFYYLIKTPRVMNKLRQQLEQQYNDGRISDPITLEESLQMPYL